MKKPLSLLALSLLSVPFVACGPTQGTKGRDVETTPPDMAMIPTSDPDADNDHDGFRVRDGDCDDNDNTIYPGAPELCDHKDHNCNGMVDEICDDDSDGYNICPGGDARCTAAIKVTNGKPGGDCNDADPNINPGAYEVVGNQRDDNCNGVVDEPTPSCDVNVFPVDAPSFAKSMEICTPWLQGAQFNQVAAANGRNIVPRFGFKTVPQASASMALFSTGIAYVDVNDPTFASPRPGTRFQGMEPNPLILTSTNVCTNEMQAAVSTANDMTSLTLTITAPTNAKAFLFKFNFFSAEYSDFVGSTYNDMFVVNMTSKKTNGNIVFDTNQQPITVNSGFFAVCLSQPICTNGGHTCVKGPGDLDGTGYDQYIVGRTGEQVGGATGWLTTSAPITPGETFTLQFFIFDAADHDYDSAVLIDGFQWLFDDTVTMPVTG